MINNITNTKNMKNLKEFTIDQVANIFQIEKFTTLTPMFYKGQKYQFQFNFEDETYHTMNIIKMVNPVKIVGFFKF